MRRYGGAVIPMQQSFDLEQIKGLKIEVGSMEQVLRMHLLPPLSLFDDTVLDFMNTVSGILMKDKAARAYPDVVTLGFWLRKANLLSLKAMHLKELEGCRRIGRGLAFHIAPSNVPVNYAYSLFTGLLCGNANIVKIPSKTFPQVELINRSIQKALEEWQELAPYIALVRYGHETEINDVLSAMADARVIWGGDRTIGEIRKSPLKSRAVEVAFADRFSLAVVDADAYLELPDRKKTAVDFYNDTYLTDQNACTSPRLLVWMGNRKEEAKRLFWSELHTLVKEKYQLQPVQAVNKLTSLYLAAAKRGGLQKTDTVDNLIYRVRVEAVSEDLMEYKENSGYFYEYDCQNIEELYPLCNDVHCQTVSYLGDKELLLPLLEKAPKGIDRVVPMGKTMDFELIWDGYQLLQQLSRSIRIY